MVDDTGRVVGVVVSKLDEVKIARATGNFTQDINFAIKGLTAKAALEAFGVKYETSSRDKLMRTVDIAAEAAKYTIPIYCLE